MNEIGPKYDDVPPIEPVESSNPTNNQRKPKPILPSIESHDGEDQTEEKPPVDENGHLDTYA